MMGKVLAGVKTDIRAAMRAYLKDISTLAYDDGLTQRIHQVCTELFSNMLQDGEFQPVFDKIFGEVKLNIGCNICISVFMVKFASQMHSKHVLCYFYIHF